MRISYLMDLRSDVSREYSIGRRFVPRSMARLLHSVLMVGWLGGAATAQDGALVLERNGVVISLEPYAPNVLRVTMSTDRAGGTGAPGYGFVKCASLRACSWTRSLSTQAAARVGNSHGTRRAAQRSITGGIGTVIEIAGNWFSGRTAPWSPCRPDACIHCVYSHAARSAGPGWCCAGHAFAGPIGCGSQLSAHCRSIR
jgi:hypothetical protein